MFCIIDYWLVVSTQLPQTGGETKNYLKPPARLLEFILISEWLFFGPGNLTERWKRIPSDKVELKEPNFMTPMTPPCHRG